MLGIGHTNAHVVHEWASHPIENCELICVSRFPTATYSGMLPGTLGRQFGDDEMRIDLQSLADRSQAKIIFADTCGIDRQSREILFTDHDPIAFDALSIGVGSVPAGLDQHRQSTSLVPIKPMQTFLQRLDHQIDINRESNSDSGNCQSPLRVAIVGGGVASIEIAFCLEQRFQKGNLSNGFAIEIFTSSDSIAKGMNSRSVVRLRRMLEKRKIKVHCQRRVEEANSDHIVTNNGVCFDADIVIWATGAAAPPVLSKLGLRMEERGFIATSQTLQSLSDPQIFAVGDSGTVVQSPSPKAGVYAVRQCPVLWHNLRALMSGETMQQFEPQTGFLKILNTGDGKAFLQYGRFTAHARWCWKFKTWLDKSFIKKFQSTSFNTKTKL